MVKAYKTEMKPTPEQITIMVQSMGVCRFLYNQYLAMNRDRHDQGKKFISGYDFDKHVNHELSQTFPWIKETCGSKARKKAIMNAESAFKRFFQGLAKKPRFKKKQRQDIGIYFPKNNRGDLLVERHRIKVPTLGWMRLKEKGYIPSKGTVKSCTLTQQADRFYISVLVEDSKHPKDEQPFSQGIGIDLGLSEFAIVSDGRRFQNINPSSTIKRTEKRLKRTQRELSRKYESQKKRGEKPATKGGRNIAKNILKVQKLQARLSRIREAFRSDVVSMIAKTKPLYITLEKLNVQGMMRNRHLSKAIQRQGFYDFKQKLRKACTKFGIELREVNFFYPSSKLCSDCGHKKTTLSLAERRFTCESCGHTLDRDLNAAINLMQANEYVVLT